LKLYKAALESMQPAFLKPNLTTSDKLSQFFQDLDEYSIKEKNLFGVLPMLGSAWKKRIANLKRRNTDSDTG
jgi:hypothetical protein